MSKDNSNGDRVEKLVQQAAGVVVASENKIGYRQAMSLVGFEADEVGHAALYKRVIRRSKAMLSASSTPVPVVQVSPNQASLSSLTTEGSPVVGTPTTVVGTPINVAEEAAASKPKKFQRTVKELQRFNAKNNAAKERQKQAMKASTVRIKHSLDLPLEHPDKKSIRVIVDEVNKIYQSNVNPQTAARYVRKGLIGTSPLKSGPVGDIPPLIYEALKGGFCTYLKLEQASCYRYHRSSKAPGARRPQSSIL
jgi:hypothetical protein